MALTKTPALVLKEAEAHFHQTMAGMPEVWKNHVMTIPSTTKKTTLAFPGFIGTPRVFQNARQIKGFQDFKFDVVNQTFELTILVDLEDFEDDQVGGINSRFRELGEVWGTFKDQLFAELLENGATTAPPFNDDPGVTWATFYEDGGTVGGGSSADNDLTSAIVLKTDPTAQEILTAMRIGKANIVRFDDDTGRPIFNATAIRTVRCVVPPEFDVPFAEASRSATIIGDDTAGGSRDNPQKASFEFDVLPYLANTDTFYGNLLGAERKPFIHQTRTPLQIIIDTNPTNMQERNGVLVLCRERFVMTYGEMRRSWRQVFTTAS